MKYVKHMLVFVFSILLFTGCGHVRKLDKSNEYQKAKSYNKEVILPRDLNIGKVENRYPIPKARAGSYDVSILPPGSNRSSLF